MSDTIQQEITQLNLSAVKLWQNAQISKALELTEQAVDLARKHLAATDQQLAECLQNLAALYKAQGEYQKAERSFQESLSITRKNIGENSSDYVGTLGQLSNLYLAMEKFDQAEEGFRQVLQAMASAVGEQNEMYLTNLINLASLYKRKGDLIEAEELYDRAKQIAETVWQASGPNYAILLSNIGHLYYELGRYIAARQEFQHSLELTRNSLGDQHPQYAKTLNNLGSVEEAAGLYARAAAHYEAGLKILQSKLGDVSDVAAALNNLAGVFQAMGDWTRAEEQLQGALAIWKKLKGTMNGDYASSLERLADVYFDKGDYPAAKQTFEAALEIRRKTFAEDQPDFACSLNNTAVLYKRMGEYELARKYLDQALSIRIRVHTRRHPDVAITLHNLAALHLAQRDYEEATQYFDESLEIKRAIFGAEHPSVAETQYQLAFLSVASSKLSQAISLFEAASASDDRLIEDFFSIGGEQQRLKYIQTIRNNLDAYLTLVLQHFQGDAEIVRKAFNLVLRRKGIVLESARAQRDAVLQDRYPECRGKLRELARLRLQIAQAMRGKASPANLQERDQPIKELDSQRYELERELATQIPETSLALRLEQANVTAVGACLPAEAILLEFMRINIFDYPAAAAKSQEQWLNPRYIAFVLSQQKDPQVHLFDLGEAQKIDDLIASLKKEVDRERARRSLYFGDDVHQAASAADAGVNAFDLIGCELHTLILGQVSELAEDRRRWFLAADGDLACLPFEVLPCKNGRRVIDDHEISYLSVGRELLSFGSRSVRDAGEPLVVADPDFDLASAKNESPFEECLESGVIPQELNQRGIKFERLPGSRREGEQIGALLATSPLLDQSATKSRVKAAASPAIVHLATHGYFLPISFRQLRTSYSALDRLGIKLENPLLRTGLALAGAMTYLKGGRLPPEAEDGILSGEDLRGMDLSATRLIVLSACDTGLGDIHPGEGVFGLRRAAALSGARALVMSLWKVPDEQTQELMVLFYRRILNNEPVYSALRAAQLQLKERYPHPFDWGAFVCQGDPGAIREFLATKKNH